MDFFRDADRTTNHRDILQFLSDCDDVSKDKVLDFSFLQQTPLIRYSASFMILQWQEEKQDFLIKYWGSHITEVFGLDLTGRFLAIGEHVEDERYLIMAHYEAMKDQKKVFLGGAIDWGDKSHKQWNEVIQPLSRDGNIGETLTYVTFK
ncbi:hypothetical protein [Kiloniella antarctica]|uniref:Uncharacterized protein n=1 Tax=Kiloniella antarctica TaxID=1550907 RepID=A0ABW5BJM0_9PROT